MPIVTHADVNARLHTPATEAQTDRLIPDALGVLEGYLGRYLDERGHVELKTGPGYVTLSRTPIREISNIEYDGSPYTLPVGFDPSTGVTDFYVPYGHAAMFEYTSGLKEDADIALVRRVVVDAVVRQLQREATGMQGVKTANQEGSSFTLVDDVFGGYTAEELTLVEHLRRVTVV